MNKALETLRKLQKCRHTYYHTNNPCGDCEKCQYYVDSITDLDDAVDTAVSVLEQSILKEDDKVYVIASPDMAKDIEKTELSDILMICKFMKPNTAVVVKVSEFEKMIDNGEWFTRGLSNGLQDMA